MSRLLKFCVFSFAFCALSFRWVFASETLRLPKGPIQGQPVIDLPAPFSVQSVTLKDSVAISWEWPTPEVMPSLVSFGFEIQRQDGKIFVVAGRSFTDTDVAIGSYTYVVRVRGESKSKTHGQRYLSHLSDWSAPVNASLTRTCADPPQVTLSVETTEKKYASVPSLRMHLIGDALVPEGCHLLKTSYHLDTGTGIEHSGALETDANGHIDAFINAIGPDDEVPSGIASFAVSATAEDEAGPTTSSVYTIDVELENPYAPKN